MKSFRFFTLGILAAIILLCVSSWILLPSKYQVESEVVIDSELAHVFNQVNELEKWKYWAFANSGNDSTLVANYEGAKFGVGAIYSWTSESGAGRMEIIESVPNQKIALRSIMQDGQFISEMVFFFKNEEGKTTLKWIENGEYGWNPLNRFVAYLLDFEGKIYENYHNSLLALKKVSEDKTVLNDR